MATSAKNSLASYAGQLVYFGLFIAALMYFSTSPKYRHFLQDQSQIKVSISHAGQPKGDCKKRTAEELAKLSPNMRVETVCPRERSVVQFDLELDGKTIFTDRMEPTGIKRDSSASAYHSLRVEPGQHRLVARLKDHEQLAEPNYVKQIDINLAPAQSFTIDFDIAAGGFVFR